MSEKTAQEYEEEIVKQIESLQYIISGLKDYGPYLKVVEMFEKTRKSIDDNWHLVSDPVKLSELRMTKYAVNTLIDYIPNIQMDLEKLHVELAKVQNPDDIVHKDYDPR